MRIAIYIQNHIQALQINLAQEMKKLRYNINFYSNNTAHVKYLKSLDLDFVDEIKYLDLNYYIKSAKEKKNYKSRQVFYEKKMQTTYINFLSSHRVYGIEYAIGSKYHPRHSLSDVDYKKICLGLNNYFDFWSNEIKKKKIKVIISGEREHFYVAKINNIKFRAIERSRYKNYHYWSESQFKQIKNFKEIYYNISKKNKKFKNTFKLLTRAYDAEFLRRERNLNSFKFKYCIIISFKQLMKNIYTKIIKSKFTYNLYSSFLISYRKWFHFKFLKKNSHTLAELIKSKKKFILYPLHTEPEPQILVNSPFFFFQQALIALISRYLPSEYILVVKESLVGIGRRDIGFYKKIQEFKNVVLIDPLEEGVEVIKKAELVCTISGTAGLEAAILGKPVISLSPYNDYNVCKHVYYLEKLSEIEKIIKLQLEKGKKYKKDFMKSGYNYLLAIKNTSFDLYDYNHKMLEKYVLLKNSYKKSLVQSFLKSL